MAYVSDAFILENVAAAGSGAVNATVFMRRAWHGRGPRRAAALLLASLFTGAAVDACAQLHTAEPDLVAVAARVPLLLASLATTALLMAGAGR